MNSEHLNLTLRPASESDSESLLKWRNDPVTRAFSIRGDLVTPQDHDIWLNRTLRDSFCMLLIGEIDGQPIGMARINIIKDSNVSQVSINLSPEFRGKGISKQLLKESLEIGAASLGTNTKFLAEIHIQNVASKKIFESLGFIKSSDASPTNFETYLVDSDLFVSSK